MKSFIIYLIVVNALAVFVTAIDKFIAVKNGSGAMKAQRIPEAELLGIGLIGGAPAMFVTMLIIRHKTRHPKFMIGLPVIMLAEAAVIVYLYVSGRVTF